MKLTSAEISNLWTTYMNDSGNICHLNHELNNVADKKTKDLLQATLTISELHITTITKILDGENYPIPHGFKLDEDVSVTAPRLFSDTYLLLNINALGKMGLQAYSMALPVATRNDVYTFFSSCLSESDDLIRKSNTLLLSKGLYSKAPYLPVPNEFDFIEKKSFLAGYFGERRPLIGTEITNLYANFKRNALGSATMIGYSQVANKSDVVAFILRGKEISQKHCDILGSLLKENDLPIPVTWETEVTDSTYYTFSDRKMLFYITALTGISTAFYGASIALSPRRDIGVMYSRLIAEVLKFADDGAKLMIKYGWMEEPPRSLDRNELATEKQN